MQISFSGRIPIATGKVYDKVAQKCVDTTTYEIDCKDESDATYLGKKGGSWGYIPMIECAIAMKRIGFTPDDGPLPPFIAENENSRFFAQETDDGKLVSVCSIHSDSPVVELDFIESDRKKNYKYAGQTMLAAVIKEELKNQDKKLFVVRYPSPDAKPFYKKCGFEPLLWDTQSSALKLNREGMEDFVEATEKKLEEL